MDVETAIRAFASAGHDLPREAMRWALDHWDGAEPDLLGDRGVEAQPERRGPMAAKMPSSRGC